MRRVCCLLLWGVARSFLWFWLSPLVRCCCLGWHGPSNSSWLLLLTLLGCGLLLCSAAVSVRPGVFPRVPRPHLRWVSGLTCSCLSAVQGHPQQEKAKHAAPHRRLESEAEA